MSLLLGLEYDGQYDPRVRDEFEQVTASIQTGFNALGAVTQLRPSDLYVTGSGSMTWALPADPNLAQVNYGRLGPMVFLNFFLRSTTVGGSAKSQLKLLLPDGMRVRTGRIFSASVSYSDNGTLGAGMVFADGRQSNAASTPNFAVFVKLDSSNWALSTNNTFLHGQLWIEVE